MMLIREVDVIRENCGAGLLIAAINTNSGEFLFKNTLVTHFNRHTGFLLGKICLDIHEAAMNFS